MTDPKADIKWIKRGDMSPSNVLGVTHIAKVKINHTLEDIMKPEYWAHVAGESFRGFYNEIKAVWEDNSKVAILFVRSYDKAGATVGLLSFHDFDKAAVPQPDVEAPKEALNPAVKSEEQSDEQKAAKAAKELEAKTGPDPEYARTWVDQSVKYRISRRSDGATIEEKIPSKEAADEYIKGLKTQK